MKELQYPIGQFEYMEIESNEDRLMLIESLAMVPMILRGEVENLNDEQLDTQYRPGGWTVRQVIHHLPDSHMNAYLRFKWTLTEIEPTIKPYEEALWAELFDGKRSNIDLSLNLLDALHRRWDVLLRAMTGEDFEKAYHHPETGSRVTLNEALALYEWHGRHHIAQVSTLKQRMGWI
ncbi:MAG: bacillithiol transferase BstA [Melioribacteraceae bacterium]|nr:bacillithiol transferase BstA [Melioribacteraceae bacterium]